jgi:hypothetical protein
VKDFSFYWKRIHQQLHIASFEGTVAVLILFSMNSTSAQVFGKRSFEFLNTPVSARMAALGGINVSLADRDVNFFYANPALNGDTLSGVASANYQFYVGDIGHAAITYARKFQRAGMITFAMQHMNYGTIQGYDASGIETQEYTASETALLVSRSHQIGNYRLGATFKGVFSNLAAYRATALAIDLGGAFIHPTEDFTVALVIRNAGVVLSDYTASRNSRLPIDVQVGSTFKPEHMPLRFTVSAYNLLSRSLSETNVGETDPTFVQHFFSHMNFGGELLLHKNINLLLGYNYLNHRTLKLEEGGGGAGISAGFSATVKMIDFVVSRTAYVAGNAAYSFTLSGNINSYLKKRKL